MQSLLKRIWQWIKRFFGQLLISSPKSASLRYGGNEDKANRPLTDTDYEFLFSQLLDGVAHGWHEGRILKYFEDLGERGKARLWVTWLEKFGEKALSSSAPNLQLAARMMRLGELAQSFQAIEPIGKAAYDIGRQLYTREAGSTVWEYEGPDNDLTEPRSLGNDLLPTPQDTISPDTSSGQDETLTLEELTDRLQNDSELVAQLCQQLGIQSTDPQEIVNALIAQFQSTQSSPDIPNPPETVEGWFEQGIGQANSGDLEGAIASWDEALAINPSLAQGWHNRGSALGTLGRLEEAIASFDKVLALNPQDFQALNAKGNALYNLEQWEKAITCWEQALGLQPSYYQAWYYRGTALENLGRIEEAIASYRRALDIQPDFELAQTRLKELS